MANSMVALTALSQGIAFKLGQMKDLVRLHYDVLANLTFLRILYYLGSHWSVPLHWLIVSINVS